jgi:hypothetical protein
MITFTGISSVTDRTIFTNKGPIVKRPLNLLTGSDLRILSETVISIPSGNFSSTDVGKLISISGSPLGRNDGDFLISKILTSKKLQLSEASFSILDESATITLCIGLVNDLKRQYEFHRTKKVTVSGNTEGVHGTDDVLNYISVSDAINLPSAIALANNIKAKLNLHLLNISLNPPVHKFIDDENEVLSESATDLASLIILLNDIRTSYETHRQNHFIHLNPDIFDRVTTAPVKAVTGTYPDSLTGPFTWVLKDPRYGQFADDPSDVDVIVNGSPVSVDAVFGLIGAIVLSNKPVHGNTVSVSYDYVKDPPSRFLRLNSPEFVLNQEGVTNYAGVPDHRYSSRSHLVTSVDGPPASSPFQPLRRGWKYKALERAYTAGLNDSASLLLNVPTNKTSFPVLFETVPEVTIKYDPATLPQNSADPWTLEGDGTFSIAPGGTTLTIVDTNIQTGVDSLPPFFSHGLDLKAKSILSAAFRARMSDSQIVFSPDGVFSGVCFGVSDGRKVALTAFILTEATNLSSSIMMINEAKAAFNAHVYNVGSHFPDDSEDVVIIVDATDLGSLVILANELKNKINAHFAKGGGVGYVHENADTTNTVTLPDAEDLLGAIDLTNAIRTSLNAHEVQSLVHFTDDSNNSIGLVRQVGLLLNGGFPELASSWSSVAADWREYKTYRIFRASSGDVQFYMSGDVLPLIEIKVKDLPALSDIDGKFELVQQAFFGTIGKESKSSSDWKFIRVNIQPVDSNFIENNKRVDYTPIVIPELDSSAPWITYGSAGIERILSSNILLVDSTASAASADLPALGLTSGAYRGYLRFEPILSEETASVLDFRMSADYWTHSVSNKALGLFIDDSDFTIQLAFLQASPSPATITGTVIDPFVLVTGDSMIFQIGTDPIITVSFSLPPDSNTASSVAAKINSVVGFPFASAVSGRVKLTSPDSGASANFTIISGGALAKLGFSPGIYFGLDSNPEPKISWFGANLPDLDTIAWERGGEQSVSLFSRTLRIFDSSLTDYANYTINDPLVTDQVLNPAFNWKVDFRIKVISSVPSPVIPSSNPLIFAGAFVSIDEGPGGKNLELQLAVDNFGSTFLNLLSYNQITSSLNVIAQYAFSWNDGEIHSFSVYTSKASGYLMVLADGTSLTPIGPAPNYNGLNPGNFGPAITFGSGGEPVTGADLRTCQSVVDWYSVSAIKDSKIDNESVAKDLRYIGIYKGGPVDVLSSYYLHQINWRISHSYRIIRDPATGIQIYVDGEATPVIAISYDVLTLPPISSSFLLEATNGSPSISFGAFSPSEISRTRWEFVRYSIGKITLTDRIIPPHQVLNQANVIASPDHLKTTVSHNHQGFTVYSGGTPLDDFMSNSNVEAYTILGEGTPPVPATQNLETRNGMVKVATPLDMVSAIDAVNERGFISDLENDYTNVAINTSEDSVVALDQLIALSNNLRSAYDLHRISLVSHVISDVFNIIAAIPAVSLITAITLLNDIRMKYNAHLIQPGVHSPDDITNSIVSPAAYDFSSAIVLANELKTKYSSHIRTGSYHIISDTIDPILVSNAYDLMSAITLSVNLANNLSTHALSTTFHESSDAINGKFARVLPGVGSANVMGLDVIVTQDGLDVGQLVIFLDGPNANQERTVLTRLSQTEYRVVPGFIFDDPIGSNYTKLGIRTLSSGTVAMGVGISIISVTGNQVAPVVGDSFIFLDGPNAGIATTVIGLPSYSDPTPTTFGVSPGLPVFDPTSRTFSLVSTPSVPSVDPNAVIDLSNSLKARINNHRTALDIHRTNDTYNIITAPEAIVLVDTYPLLNDMKTNINAHLSGHRYHLAEDSINIISASEVNDILLTSIDTINSVREAYLLHTKAYRVHLADDDINVILPPLATDLPSGIILANAIKNIYNRHISAVIHEVVGSPVQKVHSTDDLINAVTASDASDADTFTYLVQDIVNSYNSHRVQPGIHGSTLFIRLDAPHRVLYEGIKFWNFDSGCNLAVVSPFSDDDTLHISSPVYSAGTVSYSYTGEVLPEADPLRKVIDLANDLKESFNFHRTALGIHLVNDSVNIVVSPNAFDLPSAIILLIEIKSKFDLHLHQVGVHVANDLIDSIVAADPTVLAMAITLATELHFKFDLHRLNLDYHVVRDNVNSIEVADPPPPWDAGWQLLINGPGSASVDLLPADGAVKVSTLAPGATAVYKKNLGLPDSNSVGFDFEIRIRISNFEYSPNVDTGIYSGFLSDLGPGVAAAVGFGAFNNVPYVKIQDVKANRPVLIIPFNWADGLFHTYRITLDPVSNSLLLTVDSQVVSSGIFDRTFDFTFE